MMPEKPKPLSVEAQTILEMSAALRQLNSENLDELEQAAFALRTITSRGGTLALAALLELKVVPLPSPLHPHPYTLAPTPSTPRSDSALSFPAFRCCLLLAT